MKVRADEVLYGAKVILVAFALFAVYYFTGVMDAIDQTSPYVQFLFVQGAFYGLLYLFLHHVGGVKGKAARISYGVLLFIGDSGEGEQSFREERERHSGPKAKDLGA